MKTQSNRLTFSQQFFIATMLFGLFFGAGNLIFPTIRHYKLDFPFQQHCNPL